jgi:predicted Zn-dependent protease
MGLPHCDRPGCVMQYSQTLHDTDIKQCRFCADCLRELSRLPEPAGER